MGIADATDYCAMVESGPIPTLMDAGREDGLTPAMPARSMKKRQS
jgi:hypothetical protein